MALGEPIEIQELPYGCGDDAAPSPALAAVPEREAQATVTWNVSGSQPTGRALS
jgi:hypothetical protein